MQHMRFTQKKIKKNTFASLISWQKNIPKRNKLTIGWVIITMAQRIWTKPQRSITKGSNLILAMGSFSISSATFILNWKNMRGPWNIFRGMHSYHLGMLILLTQWVICISSRESLMRQQRNTKKPQRLSLLFSPKVKLDTSTL